MFTVSCTSDKIWNYNELVKYLAANQGQLIELDINPEAICLHNLGLYNLLDSFKFAGVKITTWNPFEQHPVYTIQCKGPNSWFRRIAKINPDLHTWDLSKKFLCFYHRPTAARLGLAAHVFSNHHSTSTVHFSTTDPVDFEMDKLLHWNIDSAAKAAGLLTQLPLLQGSTDGYTAFDGYHYSDPLTAMYKQILVDIVVESHVAGDTFFPTEKTIRPMLLKKPFIVFGSRDYLVYLRQMGFRTFHDFWDEDYDGYEAADRLNKIQTLIDSIAQKSTEQLEKMYHDMQYTLNHNYNLLMTQTYQKKLTHL